ncbi:MAG: hypothetical protein ACI3XR_03035 [Eubacteriales bacterium]
MKNQKNNTSRNEKLFDLMTETEDGLLDAAYKTDSADKLKKLAQDENSRRNGSHFHSPTFRRSAVAAACLILAVGAVFTISARFTLSEPSGIVVNSTASDKQLQSDSPEEHPDPGVPSYDPDVMGPLNINSLDMLNYYSAIRILTTPSESSLSSNGIKTLNLSTKSRSCGNPYEIQSLSYSESTEASDKENLIYYEIDPNDVFMISMVAYFQFELTDENGFLASKIGTGLVEAVITENSLDPMITFKNGNRYYSCLVNGGSGGVMSFSSHKYIEGFCIVKNFEQDNYTFDVGFSDDAVIGIHCNYFKTLPETAGYAPDETSFIEGSSRISFDGGSFTIAELENYYQSQSNPDESAPDSNLPENENQERFVPKEPDDSTLEFWIADNVADVDFSGHNPIYGWFGAEEYYGAGYQPTEDSNGNTVSPRYFVSYVLSAYPDYADGGRYVTGITITDPSVTLYGFHVLSTAEEFNVIFTNLGYAVTNRGAVYTAEKDGVTFSFTPLNPNDPDSVATLTIQIQVTNREGICF